MNMEQLWLEHDLSEEWIPRSNSDDSDSKEEIQSSPNATNTNSSKKVSTAPSSDPGTFKKGSESSLDIPQWKQINAKNPVARDIFAKLDLENLFDGGGSSRNHSSSSQKRPDSSSNPIPSSSPIPSISSEPSRSYHAKSLPRHSFSSQSRQSPTFLNSSPPTTSSRPDTVSDSSPPHSQKSSSSPKKDSSRSSSRKRHSSVTNSSKSSSPSSMVSSPSVQKGNSSPLKLFQGASDPFTREHLNQLAQDVKSNSFESPAEDSFPLPSSRRVSKPVRTTERKAGLNTKDLYQEVEEVMAKLRGRIPAASRESTVFLPRKLSGLQEEEEQNEASEFSKDDSSNPFPSLSDQLHLRELEKKQKILNLHQNQSETASNFSPPSLVQSSAGTKSEKQTSYASSEDRLKDSYKSRSQKTRNDSKNQQDIKAHSENPNMVVITPADLPDGINTTQGSMEYDRVHNRWRRRGHDSDIAFDFGSEGEDDGFSSNLTVSYKAAEDSSPPSNQRPNFQKKQPNSFPMRKETNKDLKHSSFSLRDVSNTPSQVAFSFQDFLPKDNSHDNFNHLLANNSSDFPADGPTSTFNSPDKTHDDQAMDEDYSFSVSKQSITRLLEDVEPYHPFWKRIIQLDISRRDLNSLIGLSEQCPCLEDLNIESNELSYLTGCPSSIRNLNAVNNHLSSLTTFSHLINLQYLDLSSNQLEDLTALSPLIHLRELNVDNNQLWNIDGILRLDGLLKLSARGNRFRHLSFTNSNLNRLEELLLGNSALESIEEISSLQNLMVLQLDGNQLTTLQASQPMIHLRVLRLNNNAIQHLEVDQYPNLRTLYMDYNCFTTIPDIYRLKRLVNFSFRSQELKSGKYTFTPPLDIRNLYLSNNTRMILQTHNMLLGIKYLELANIQITELPADFAKSLPNLRVLDLSHNYISEISALKGFSLLHRLYLVGNRIEKMKNVCDTLSHLKKLTHLDLRMNPLTFSIYPMIDDPVYELSAASKYHQNFGQPSQRTVRHPGQKWAEKDSAFIKTMSDSGKSRRKMYTEAITLSCSRLEWLDGLEFELNGNDTSILHSVLHEIK
ncbi:SIN component scaffold protein [Schizosaccharomyces octosporus yFS286]|uniref:SIN component scaffold protein n=1 Tax=Schizosaccharomyces octosporus (strain yFS286) TaxID=483514 RepID=S9R5F0_SCHOY|nr:SIN component scaffold protein [Schizosaccharomyces octosporus yFS286]EPX73550.1 SIN component scaffold protein [Schizosaccharomyces octosporus yFS286]